MTAKEKIEELTNGWYGLDLFTAVIVLLQRGLGVFSILITGAGLLFSFFVTWFLGRRLLHRGSGMRVLLVVLSGLCACLGVLSTAKLGATLLSGFSFDLLLAMALGIGWVMMNVRSFRVLTDRSVKAYFG
jgi:hypothetical protein